MTEWTEAEKSKLIELYNKDIDVISIAKQLNKKLYQVIFELEKLDLTDQSKIMKMKLIIKILNLKLQMITTMKKIRLMA